MSTPRVFVRTTPAGLNLRSNVGTAARILRELPQGEPLEVLGTVQGWHRVRTSALVEGWVSGRYTEPHPAPWYAAMRQEEGRPVVEVPGGGNEPRILEYFRATTYHATADAVPWCSAAACWAMEQVGIHSPRSAAARDWLAWGKTVEPVEGCVVVLRRNGNPKQGHVGFYVRPGRERGRLVLLGGNQFDRVCEAEFDAVRVLSYRVPPGWSARSALPRAA